MNRQFIISGHVHAESRLKLPYAREQELNAVTNTVNQHNGRIVNVSNGIDRNFGPFGNVIQEVTVTVEGDYDDPKFKELYDKYQGGASSTTRNSAQGGCYIATAVYGSYDCPQVWTLRRYRDNTLAETWYGRLFIKLYYKTSPSLVKWFGKKEWFTKTFRRKLDRKVSKLNAEGVENTPYCD